MAPLNGEQVGKKSEEVSLASQGLGGPKCEELGKEGKRVGADATSNREPSTMTECVNDLMKLCPEENRAGHCQMHLRQMEAWNCIKKVLASVQVGG